MNIITNGGTLLLPKNATLIIGTNGIEIGTKLSDMTKVKYFVACIRQDNNRMSVAECFSNKQKAEARYKELQNSKEVKYFKNKLVMESVVFKKDQDLDAGMSPHFYNFLYYKFVNRK